MDWSKAKTIIIIALLITNLFMGSVYISGYREELQERELAAESAVLYAAQRGVRVSAELPVEKRKLPVLFVSFDSEGSRELRYHKGLPVETSGGPEAAVIPESEGDTNGLLITASEALIKLLEGSGGSFPQETEIDEISLVYWVDSSLSEGYALEDTAIPAWKFKSGTDCYYIEAFAE